MTEWWLFLWWVGLELGLRIVPANDGGINNNHPHYSCVATYLETSPIPDGGITSAKEHVVRKHTALESLFGSLVPHDLGRANIGPLSG